MTPYECEIPSCRISRFSISRKRIPISHSFFTHSLNPQPIYTQINTLTSFIENDLSHKPRRSFSQHSFRVCSSRLRKIPYSTDVMKHMLKILSSVPRGSRKACCLHIQHRRRGYSWKGWLHYYHLGQYSSSRWHHS